jgi:glycoprotein endo-alpha-1,2-mannosidase
VPLRLGRFHAFHKNDQAELIRLAGRNNSARPSGAPDVFTLEEIHVKIRKHGLALLPIGTAIFLCAAGCAKKITDSKPGSNGPFNASFSSSDPRLLIGACYYPWYTGGQHWNSSYMRALLNPPQPPLLGEYDCASPGTISRHVEWSVDSKIDFWITSWWGPASETDKVVLLHHLHNDDFTSKMGYCLLYETTGRLGSLPIQVNDDKIGRFLSDLEYLIDAHFGRPNYMKIDGKPVLYMYLTRTLNGNFHGLFSAADSLLIRHGYKGLFIAGDEVYWHSPDDSRARFMDAITCYNPHTSVDWVTDAGRFVERAGSEMYSPWMAKANSLGMGLWVDVIPGFNDLGVRKEENHPVIERKNGGTFDAMLRMAGSVLSGQTLPLKVLVVTSFNEWHEDTQIEPTVVTSEATKDPAEVTGGFGYIGYGTRHLDAVAEFARTFGH